MNIPRHSVILIALVFFTLFVGFKKPSDESVPFYSLTNTHWADSVFQTLSPDERIAQLFMVAAYSNKDQSHVESIKELVAKYNIGGLIFFQGGPVREVILTNEYQSLSKVPLMISIDGEWGLAMRLDSTTQYPRQMSLGAIQDDTLIYQMGAEIARQCKRMGIHVNLAPVVDVNSNPLNPVISNRSFGENKYDVAQKALMYMKGMQDNGVMANAKHFPGHGDTDSDSHKTLPIIKHTKEHIDSIDLYPFKRLMNEGLASLMVAHLYIPALDSAKNVASTLSKKIVTGLLKEELKYKGLIFTDALNMKGVSKFYTPGIVDVMALLAGNDVLLFAENVPTAIKEIKKAIALKQITQEEIDRRCKKILLAKQWCGLNHYTPVNLNNLIKDLNTPQAEMINRKLIEASLTLLQNKNNLLPLTSLSELKIASLSLGYKEFNKFQDVLGYYSPVVHFGLSRTAKQSECDNVLSNLKNFDLVIIHINNTNNSPSKNFGLTPRTLEILQQIMRQNKTVVNISANPYILAKMDSLENADAIIMSYEDNDLSQSLSAQLIFGAVAAGGKLPVTASSNFKYGMGITTKSLARFKYTLPEELGLSSFDFDQIDSIALDGIKEKAYPGCEILVAKAGKVIYQKSFGYHTYENKQAVSNSDLYDIASVTKIAASTAALMKLVEEKKINLDDRLCDHLPNLEGTNKENITIREMMTHQAGLLDWIPFWLHTMKKGQYIPGIYSTAQSDSFPTRVAENLFIRKNYTDTIYSEITTSRVKDAGKYKYSDLGYYYLKKIIEQKSGLPLNEYVTKHFYNSLGLPTMGYLPRERFPLTQIIPTEFDVKFRKQLIHGDVHDQGAAMMGGVGGHAGLFSNASDLAVMMQMYLQKGEYGGVRYLDTAVVSEFTRCQYCVDNRRAVGFDKPETNSSKDSPVCSCVSYLSFGHSGFTGTITWADPEKQLIYVFLSNRVYPDADVNKLVKLGTRTKIQQAIYNAVK